MKTAAFIILISVLIGIFLSCSNTENSKNSSSQSPALEDSTAEISFIELKGQRLYQYYCSLCHGTGGQGNGFNAYNLEPRPRDLTDIYINALNDEDLLATIKGGGRSIGKSILMPPWGNTLSEKDIKAIIRYIRTLSQTETKDVPEE